MRRPSRVQSYTTILLGALSFGLLGAAFDQVTVTISPDYFILGKRLAQTSSLRGAAALMGFAGGLPIGALVLGALAWLQQRGHVVRLPVVLATCAVSFLVASMVIGLFLLICDPFQVRADSGGVLSAEAADRYLIAWGLHIGAYVGPLASVVLVAVRARWCACPGSVVSDLHRFLNGYSTTPQAIVGPPVGRQLRPSGQSPSPAHENTHVPP